MLRHFAVVLPPYPIHLFSPSYCDASQARSYFTSTILVFVGATGNQTLAGEAKLRKMLCEFWDPLK
jgi:hypothetical protein